MTKIINYIAPGNQNWASQNNGNIAFLLNQIGQLTTQLNKVYEKIEQLDIIHTYDDRFVVLELDLQSNVKLKLCQTSNSSRESFAALWDYAYTNNLPDTKQSITIGDFTFTFDTFDSSSYAPYDAFFVLTKVGNNKPNGSVDYEGRTWNTGDLLILNRYSGDDSSIEGSATSIEQWKNVMGGYYKPSSMTLNNNGVMDVTYIMRPNAALTGDYTVEQPYVYWKPTEYTPNGKVTFEPYNSSDGSRMDASQTQFQPKTLDTSIIIAAATKSFDITASTIDAIDTGIQKITSAGVISDLYVSFRNSNNQIVYLAYQIDTTGSTYKIKLDPSYLGTETLKMYVSLYKAG